MNKCNGVSVVEDGTEHGVADVAQVIDDLARAFVLTPRRAERPIVEPVTKLGGQPVWLGPPQWPLCQGIPMRFIAQVRLPGAETRLAYVFMTDPEEYEPDFHVPWDPYQANAVVVQPGGAPLPVETAALAEGPTLHGWNSDGSYGAPIELAVEIAPCRGDADPGVLVGGSPDWLEGDESPGPDWPLLLQIDSARVHFAINCGDAGMAFAFLDPAQEGGVFFVQSC